jgi:hypothetical protein
MGLMMLGRLKDLQQAHHSASQAPMAIDKQKNTDNQVLIKFQE